MTCVASNSNRNNGSMHERMPRGTFTAAGSRRNRVLKEYTTATSAAASASSACAQFVSVDLSVATTCIVCDKYTGPKSLVAICGCKECEGTRAHAACLSKFRGVTEMICPGRVNCRCKQQNAESNSDSTTDTTSCPTVRPKALAKTSSTPSSFTVPTLLSPDSVVKLHKTQSCSDFQSPSTARKQRLRAMRAQLMDSDGGRVSRHWQSQQSKHTSNELKEMDSKELSLVVEALQQALSAMSGELVKTLQSNTKLRDHLEVLKIHSKLILTQAAGAKQ